MKVFAGRTAFVTGAASGIGLAIVRHLLKEGMNVVVADCNPEHLEEARATLGEDRSSHLVRMDVSDRDQVREAAAEAIEAFGKIHVLCNNAGVGGGGDVHDPDFEGWDRAISINLGGVVNGIKIITPHILSHGEGGHIVNTSSMAAIVPQAAPGLGAYQTAKCAVRGLSESLRTSLAPRGIGVSCLLPGGTRTRITEEHVKDETLRPAVRELVARWMDPMEVGARVVEGIRCNAPYILTHSMGFPEEVRELHSLFEDSFPREGSVLPELEEFERERRESIKQVRSLPVKD